VTWNTDGPRFALGTLTVIPVRVSRVDRDVAGAGMLWAPAVGLLIGAGQFGVLAGARWAAGDGLLPAALAIAAGALLTRGLHLDGLADFADGLGSQRPADEALTIMKKSDIGPFGVITLVLTLAIQVAALAEASPAAVIVATGTGRVAATWACRAAVPAARPDGLGALVAGTVRTRDAALATIAIAVVSALAGFAAGGVRLAVLLPAAVAAGLAVSAGVLRHAVRRLGGITGDVLGALIELAATAALLVAAIH
jgi:adenosylcobinamide-GDP ribazoletransferase